jgi:hypothetical protein
MNKQEKTLEKLQIINGVAEGDLSEAISWLDEHAKSVEDGEFKHYLLKRSYGKALHYFETGIKDAGPCGRHMK